MYNGFIATNTRLKKNKTAKDSPSTAGMAKAPTGGLKGREELKSLGERMDWTVREVSMREIRQMSADETLWHEAFNKENWDRAFTLAENQRTNKERMEIWDKRRMWGGRATPEETEKARAAGDAFATRHPTFARTVENAQEMVRFLEENDLDGTKIESYSTAFRELSAQGKLTLVEPQSADEYLAEHADELLDRRIPPLIAGRHQREQNTAAHFAKSASATNEGSVTRVVDYGQQKHGVPPESEKYSFKMKVRAMSADELAQRCADDPTFRKALDELK